MRNFFCTALLGLCLLASAQTTNNEWKEIFNTKDLKGWSAVSSPKSFRVENKLLVCSGNEGLLLFNDPLPYKNFEWVAELKTEPHSNAGIVFHTDKRSPSIKGYEVVIHNTYAGEGKDRVIQKTGSLLAIRNVFYNIAEDNEWFQLRINVIENHITVFVNGLQVVDYIQPENPWRSAATTDRLLRNGAWGIQLHKGGAPLVCRSIKIKRLPDAEKATAQVSKQWDSTITKLMDAGFPLIDFHVHLKGGLTLEQVMANSLRLGINYGVAPNCGLHFPVTDDVSLNRYMDTVKGQPIFRGMQAEGREWIHLFSPAAITKFDYVFTDAMTFTDTKGRRNRIWIPEEVWVDDKETFMNDLVNKIESIFSQEPVDIYVNPTMLPQSLMPEYDQLWTKERMERVIKVIAANGIAMEINSRYKIPNATMIKMAKKAGIKFTFGTNNPSNDLGQLEYSIRMIKECGLQPSDIFLPKPQNKKPVIIKGLPKKITG